MGSYSQHLPKLGGTSTLEVPFLFPSITSRNNTYYINNVALTLANDNSRNDWVSLIPRKGAKAERINSGSYVNIGRGVLTHLITPIPNTSERFVFRVTIDSKDTYILRIDPGRSEQGIFGGYVIGEKNKSQGTQEGIARYTGDLSEDDVVLMSPLDTIHRGIGIPYETRIEIEKLSGKGRSLSDFMAVTYSDDGTITKES